MSSNSKKQHSDYLKIRNEYEYNFFVDHITNFYYTDIDDPKLGEKLQFVENDNKNDLIGLAIQFKSKKIECIQLGNDKNVIVIRIKNRQKGNGYNTLKKFLIRNKFISKSIGTTVDYINRKFEIDFKKNVNDFELIYMQKYDKDQSLSYMIEHYVAPLENDFSKIKYKNWDKPNYLSTEVLYAAFGVVVVYSAYRKAKILYPEVDALEIKCKAKNKVSKKETKKSTVSSKSFLISSAIIAASVLIGYSLYKKKKQK